MYKFLFILFVSTLLVQDDQTLSWDHFNRIDWSDFKAQPRNQADVIAVTASGLSFHYSTTRYNTGKLDYDFNVTAHFYPLKSWYVKEHVTEMTLAHERLHFDITELHARKFRQRVRNTKFTQNIDAEMEVINTDINSQLRNMQKLYDDETSHSRIIEKQIVWQTYVSDELKKLERYKE